MTAADLCDVAYALMVERDERLQMARIAAGADPGLLWESRQALDNELFALPQPSKVISREQMELRQALGVA